MFEDGTSHRQKGGFSPGSINVLTHLGIARACLIRVSNGGRIVLDFISEHPDMVEALIIVSTGIRGYQISGPDEEKEWD